MVACQYYATGVGISTGESRTHNPIMDLVSFIIKMSQYTDF